MIFNFGSFNVSAHIDKSDNSFYSSFSVIYVCLCVNVWFAWFACFTNFRCHQQKCRNRVALNIRWHIIINYEVNDPMLRVFFSILRFTWQPIYGMLKKSVCNKEYQKIFMLLGTWNEFWVQYMLLLLLLLLFVSSLALIKKQRLPQPNRSKQNLNHRDLANETFHMESLLK